MFIPEPTFFIPDPNLFHPGSRFRIKEVKYFNTKKWFLSSRKYDPGCSSRIRILTFYPSRIPDSGSRGHKGTASRIRNTENCRDQFSSWFWKNMFHFIFTGKLQGWSASSFRIQSGQWIRIRIRNLDPDPEGQKCRRDPLICSTLMFRTLVIVRLICRYGTPFFGYETFSEHFLALNMLCTDLAVRHALHLCFWNMLFTCCAFETYSSRVVALKLFTWCGFETCSFPGVVLKYALHLWLWNVLSPGGFETCSSPVGALKHTLHLFWQ